MGNDGLPTSIGIIIAGAVLGALVFAGLVIHATLSSSAGVAP